MSADIVKKHCGSCRKVFLFIVVIAVVTYLGILASQPVHYEFTNAHYTAKCTLPSLDPFDSSIKEFYWIPDPLVCGSTPPLIVVDGVNTVRFNNEAFSALKISSKGDVACEKRDVIRQPDDYHVKFGPAEAFTLPYNLTTDFVRVTCKTWRDDTMVFDNILTTITDTQADKTVARETDTDLSVMLFGVDSISRSASIRYLPKTKRYLEELGAYDFKGYMKVGDNTIPNILPLTSGKALTEEESPNFGQTFFDQFPFIWKNFSRSNYTTMLAEDMPHMAAFNNGYKGFNGKPTDHYMRPFWLGLAKANNVQYKMSGVYRFLEDKGLNVKKTSVFCNEETPNHAVLLRYLRQFLDKHRGNRKFIYSFLTELAHNFINFLSYGDDDFVTFLKYLKTSGDLEKMVVIVYSDHGSRFEKLRNTYIGRIESRMPMLYVLLPEKLKKFNPKLKLAMEQNTQRLVTVHDIYQTIGDILHKNFKKPSIFSYKGKQRGVSLFRPIPEDRSCADAAIPENFCACHKSTRINITNNDLIQRIAEGTVGYINNMLSTQPQCKKLSLAKVFSAEEVSLGLKHVGTSHNMLSIYRFFKPEENRQGYTISFETVPGNARFDASCEYSPKSGLKINGQIDRTNMYGNQSTCVTDKVLKLYCFC